MNTQELADKLGTRTVDTTTKTGRKQLVESIFADITAALKTGNEVSINNFGKFKVKDTPAREGRNVRTGETIQIAAAKKVKFTALKGLKDTING